MATELIIPITTVSGGNVVPVTTGAYALRVSPFTSNAYVGTHTTNGAWNFGAVESGTYRMYTTTDAWSTSSQVTAFGEFPINAGVQAKTNEVEVSAAETAQAGILYDALAGAIASFTSPASTNQCLVTISGTGTTSQYITLAHSALVSYVHVKGVARHINLILGTATATVDKTMTFSDLKVWFSNLDITTARKYTNFTFENCDIYQYNDVEYEDCVFHNCRIFNTGVACKITGTTQMTNCIVSAALTTDSFTGFYANTVDNVSASYTMPTDPLTP